MTAFRILDPFQVYTDLTGKLAAGGNLHFYEAGTTTDADVYGDEALSVNNGPIIAIGTDGRAVDDIWGDGALSYRCRVYAADGTLIRDRDNIGLPGSGGLTIPALDNSKFLTNDGTSLLWAAIRQALDPTGAANKVIGSDGTNLVWVDKPTNGSSGAAGTNADVTVTANSVAWSNGTGDRFYIECGNDSAPASGGHTASKSITFTTPFKALIGVCAVPTTSTSASSGYLPIIAVTGKTTNGFTVNMNTNSSDGGNGNFVGDTTFDWFAFGTLAAA